jgi:hypothetical protein
VPSRVPRESNSPPGGNRTRDLPVRTGALFPLSYRGLKLLQGNSQCCSAAKDRSMERMILEVISEWTALQAKMRDYTLGALAGAEADAYAKRGRYADDFILDHYKRVVREKWGVAFPQVFSDIYNGIKAFRDQFAHMVEIKSVGDGSDPTINIVRRGEFKPHPQTGEWYQPSYEVVVTHKELIDNFYAVRDAERMLHVIYRLYCLFNSKRPEDDEIWNFSFVPWWDGRWGPPPQHHDDYWAPVGRYRHHARERAYWDADKGKWHHFR